MDDTHLFMEEGGGEYLEEFSGLEPIDNELFSTREATSPRLDVEDDFLSLPTMLKVEYEKVDDVHFKADKILEAAVSAASSENGDFLDDAALETSVKETSVAIDDNTPSFENLTSTENSQKKVPTKKNNNRTAGIKAIQIAKKRAQEMATNSADQRRDRKRAAEKMDSNGKRRKTDDLSSEEDKLDPEAMKAKRHERRLQKNRDTAYISRIRRRVYTKLLEESLIRSENGKDDVEQENMNLKQQVEQMHEELATLRGQASIESRSNLSSIPSESENDELVKSSRPTTTIMNQSLAEFFQDMFAPVSPRGEYSGATMRATMFVIVLLFGLFSPGAKVQPLTFGGDLASIFDVTDVNHGKLNIGEVWDPTTVLKIEPEFLSPETAIGSVELPSSPSLAHQGAGPVRDTLSPRAVGVDSRSTEAKDFAPQSVDHHRVSKGMLVKHDPGSPRGLSEPIAASV